MHPSLYTVFEPPENPWLKSLSQAHTELPEGIRILRFSDGDTLTWDRATGIREAKRKSLESDEV